MRLSTEHRSPAFYGSTAWSLPFARRDHGPSVNTFKRKLKTRVSVENVSDEHIRRRCGVFGGFDAVLHVIHAILRQNHHVCSLIPYSSRCLILAVLFGCPHKHIGLFRLQRAQHVLARVVTQQSSRSSSLTSTKLLRQLQSSGCPSKGESTSNLPPYLSKLYTPVIRHTSPSGELLQYHKPTRSTRSSASHLFLVPRHNLSFDFRAFRIFGILCTKNMKFLTSVLALSSLKRSLYLGVI